MLDGRVKTLHPKIHGGLLGRRDLASDQQRHARRNEIQPIDLVVVNLYPFEETVAKPGVHARGRDREHRHRRPVDDPLGGQEPRTTSAWSSIRPTTPPVLEELRAERRRALRRDRGAAWRARPSQRTARYDGAIADWLGATLTPTKT